MTSPLTTGMIDRVECVFGFIDDIADHETVGACRNMANSHNLARRPAKLAPRARIASLRMTRLQYEFTLHSIMRHNSPVFLPLRTRWLEKRRLDIMAEKRRWRAYVVIFAAIAFVSAVVTPLNNSTKQSSRCVRCLRRAP